MLIRNSLIALMLAATSFAAQAEDAGDPAKGEKVFKKCKACHVADSDKNKVGPSLQGVVGRKIASVEGFKYSDAMIAFGAGDKVWDEETLWDYLHKPREVVDGTSMSFAGLKKDNDVANVIAYLKSTAE